ncbi:unnamed protein product, partial [Brenthis ino]
MDSPRSRTICGGGGAPNAELIAFSLRPLARPASDIRTYVIRPPRRVAASGGTGARPGLRTHGNSASRKSAIKSC